jgi:hypothetical protein
VIPLHIRDMIDRDVRARIEERTKVKMSEPVLTVTSSGERWPDWLMDDPPGTVLLPIRPLCWDCDEGHDEHITCFEAKRMLYISGWPDTKLTRSEYQFLGTRIFQINYDRDQSVKLGLFSKGRRP